MTASTFATIALHQAMVAAALKTCKGCGAKTAHITYGGKANGTGGLCHACLTGKATA